MKKEICFGMLIVVIVAIISGGIGYYIGLIETDYTILKEYSELTIENYELYSNFIENSTYVEKRFYKEGERFNTS